MLAATQVFQFQCKEETSYKIVFKSFDNSSLRDVTKAILHAYFSIRRYV